MQSKKVSVDPREEARRNTADARHYYGLAKLDVKTFSKPVQEEPKTRMSGILSKLKNGKEKNDRLNMFIESAADLNGRAIGFCHKALASYEGLTGSDVSSAKEEIGDLLRACYKQQVMIATARGDTPESIAELINKTIESEENSEREVEVADPEDFYALERSTAFNKLQPQQSSSTTSALAKSMASLLSNAAKRGDPAPRPVTQVPTSGPTPNNFSIN